MANSDDLLSRLRATGLRDKVAKTLSDAVSTGSRRATPPKVVRDAVRDLRKLATELEDRATGGSKRKAAAKKGAATRKRAAAKRSAAAKKGAATRAKATGKASAKKKP